jgi:riboflavin kinase/FMN adenylyltransferase
MLLRYPSKLPGSPEIAACLGNFDGIHAGHRLLLEKIVKKARDKNLKTTLVSFYPHPALVLGKAEKLPILTQPSVMVKILKDIGVDYLYLIHFTKQFSKETAEDFIQKVLIDKLNVRYILIGEDARVGAGGKGDAAFISRQFAAAGREAEIQKFLEIKGLRVSSRLVRDCLAEGDVKKAATFLDRVYSLNGRVGSGNKIGKTLGFPTANLIVKKNLLVPGNGVYATRCQIEEKKYYSVTNIGVRPSINNINDKVSIESYLIDYTGPDFYGKKLKVEFIDKLREELKFPAVEDLKRQISADIEQAKKILVA